MATQEIFRDLDLPLHRSKFVFCGCCAERRPYEELHPIGKAGGRRFEMATFDLKEFDTVDIEPGFFGSLEFGDADGTDDTADWWTREKLIKVRTGILFEVRRDAPRIDYDQFKAEVAATLPKKDPEKLDNFVKGQLGYQRSTASDTHLALVRLDDTETASFLTCWNCGTTMSVGREHLVMAVEHVKEFGGDILMSCDGIEVRDSDAPFEKKPNVRKKRPSPLPPPFRR